MTLQIKGPTILAGHVFWGYFYSVCSNNWSLNENCLSDGDDGNDDGNDDDDYNHGKDNHKEDNNDEDNHKKDNHNRDYQNQHKQLSSFCFLLKGIEKRLSMLLSAYFERLNVLPYTSS